MNILTVFISLQVVWVGEGRVLTSGFGEDRARELVLRDIRNMATPQGCIAHYLILIFEFYFRGFYGSRN